MKAPKIKKAIVSVTNDLVSDNRVHRTCSVLTEMGYEVILIGRKLSGSLPIQRVYKTYRFKLLFKRKFTFYAEYNVRLFFYLLFHRTDLLIANDLDTLVANFYISKIKKCPLLYDSHEYFTEVPELIHRKRVQRCWLKIEKKIFPQLPFAITVCDSIANEYSKKYNVPVYTIRNVPTIKENKQKKDLSLLFQNFKNVLIYQGALNIGRGIENLIKSMLYLDSDVVLLIAGKGDIEDKLHEIVDDLKLNNRVVFLGKVPIEELHAYTLNADVGFSLEENRGLNYRFALPNKIFDYIHASVPILCSDLPEMSKLVSEYNVGMVLNETQRQPKQLAQLIQKVLNDKQQLFEWKANCRKALADLNWEKEKEKLKELLQKVVN